MVESPPSTCEVQWRALASVWIAVVSINCVLGHSLLCACDITVNNVLDKRALLVVIRPPPSHCWRRRHPCLLDILHTQTHTHAHRALKRALLCAVYTCISADTRYEYVAEMVVFSEFIPTAASRYPIASLSLLFALFLLLLLSFSLALLSAYNYINTLHRIRK